MPWALVHKEHSSWSLPAATRRAAWCAAFEIQKPGVPYRNFKTTASNPVMVAHLQRVGVCRQHGDAGGAAARVLDADVGARQHLPHGCGALGRRTQRGEEGARGRPRLRLLAKGGACLSGRTVHTRMKQPPSQDGSACVQEVPWDTNAAYGGLPAARAAAVTQRRRQQKRQLAPQPKAPPAAAQHPG